MNFQGTMSSGTSVRFSFVCRLIVTVLMTEVGNPQILHFKSSYESAVSLKSPSKGHQLLVDATLQSLLRTCEMDGLDILERCFRDWYCEVKPRATLQKPKSIVMLLDICLLSFP